jgi:SAM-dependent methyltransferase
VPQTPDDHRDRDPGSIGLPDYFGESVAATYDDDTSTQFDSVVIGQTVDFLSRLADGGRALEFGIGTGRIALPLSGRGIEIHGIDLSRAMVSKLRDKPGGAAIDVTLGDFATATAGQPGTFRLAYLLFNTIMNLTTQDAQVDCFLNAAAHLEPGGRFVVEVHLPELRELPYGQQAVPFQVTPTRWAFDHYDVATQSMSSNYIAVDGGRGSMRSIPFRYVWPAELDLMARIAGMRLVERWEGWAGEPFTHESRKHISVWRKLAEPS